MSLLESLARKAVNGMADHLMDAAMGIPKDPASRELVRRHDEWLKTAKLGVRYYSHDSRFEWVSTCQGPWELECLPSWVFTRKTKCGLYTDDGRYSYRAFMTAGFRGLTTTAPSIPDRPIELEVKGDLMDDPRKWTINYK